LRVLVNQYPLRERLVSQLMRALYRAGRQSDALDVYRAARKVLLDDLGLEPGVRVATWRR
jgi:DNA-binding SARP family transcriptional activator